MVRAAAIAVVAASLVFAGPASANDQFDLVCTGTLTKEIGGQPIQSARRYRIDLAANRWCEGECATGRVIHDVSADAIILEREKPTPPLHMRVYHDVSRITGHVSYMILSDVLYEKFEGQCEPAAFSGMPKQKF